MTGLRFTEGELAIFAHARNSSSLHRIGQQVTVAHVGPFERNDPGLALRLNMSLEWASDYIIERADGTLGAVDDWQLRKLDEPDPDAAAPRETEQPLEIEA